LAAKLNNMLNSLGSNSMYGGTKGLLLAAPQRVITLSS
jgi:hypothetical protein